MSPRPRGLMRDLGIIFAGKFGSRGNQQISSALDELNRPISAPAAGTLEAPLIGRFFFGPYAQRPDSAYADPFRRS